MRNDIDYGICPGPGSSRRQLLATLAAEKHGKVTATSRGTDELKASWRTRAAALTESEAQMSSPFRRKLQQDSDQPPEQQGSDAESAPSDSSGQPPDQEDAEPTPSDSGQPPPPNTSNLSTTPTRRSKPKPSTLNPKP